MMFRSHRALRSLSSAKLQLSRLSQVTRGKQTAVFSWGIGTGGQLGHKNFQVVTQSAFEGENYVQLQPRRMVKSKRFKEVACGELFSLGLTQDGDLLGWGTGYEGEDSQANTPVPLMLPEGCAKIEKIFAGARHAAALDINGNVLTWGHGGSWFKGGGQLGHGDTTSKENPTYIEELKSYGAKVTQVSLGNSHSLFLTDDGEILSCGIDDYGRLGTGASSNATVPAPLTELLDETIVQVSAGNAHSIALTDDGRIFTWGRNDAGQLGHSDSYIDIYSMEDYPRQVKSEELKKQTVAHVTAGYQRCGVVTHEGNLFVWGLKLSHVPAMVSRENLGGLRIVAAEMGGSATSGGVISILAEDGSLWTMGDGKSKMLGMVKPPSRLTEPEKVAGEWVGKVLSLATGPGSHQAVIAEME